jgi:hypothetical protein
MKPILLFFGLLLPIVMRAENQLIETTSLLQILAQPEKYDQKEVQVIAYLHLEFEGDALYLHREDFLNSILGNSIWIDTDGPIEPKKLNDKYVIVRGTYDAKARGHMGLFSGTIKNIKQCDIWSDPKSPRRNQK